MIRAAIDSDGQTNDNAQEGVRLPLSILIVDDEQNFRHGMRRLFRTIQVETHPTVHEASGGEEAMSVLAKQSVDCVLMDRQMRGGDGIEWLKRILEINGDLPVILVTGHGDEETAVQALKSGAADYLVKGAITPEALWRTVVNAVEKATMRKALAEQREALMEAERQRVMIESLAAACHHLGQPMTNLTCYLELMRRQESSAEMRDLIAQCCADVDRTVAILKQLQHATMFRTVPYRSEGDEKILDIDQPVS